MLDFPIRDRNDPTRIAEYEETRRRLSESESGRKLLEVHDRLIAMLDEMIEEQRRARCKGEEG